MAINKVVNKSTKSHGAMRNVIEYVLQDQKVKEGYVFITGPYYPDKITWNGVYTEFLNEKKLWNKDSGRMYAHNIISFHQDEAITPEQCLEIGKKFVEKFFPNNQSIIGVHQDKNHLHIHIVTNSVSFVDGKKLHQTKRDLEKQKTFTNSLCKELGLSVTEKGKHFNGASIDEGEVIAWNKDKYNLLRNESKKSFVAECAIAILEVKEDCCSKEEFIEKMADKGWTTIWTDKKKHIIFINEKGDKVRDTNLSKSFSLAISKEELNYEFERQNELRLQQATISDSSSDTGEYEKQFEDYYREVESIIAGTGTDSDAVGSDKSIESRTKRNNGFLQDEDANSIVRDVRVEISNNRAKNRIVRDTESKSISSQRERELKEKQWTLDKERTKRPRR